MSILRKLFRTLEIVLVLFGFYFVFVNYGVFLVKISGPSMEPSFHDLDTVLIKEYPLIWRNPKREEVVIIWQPDSNTYDIKRIKAIPGDLVVSTNGNQYPLGKNQYFVLGDNDEMSYDSRHYGPVNVKQIVGIVYE